MSDPVIPTTEVTIHRGHGDCDDCGYYEWGYLAVSRGGVEVARKGWSGHLGGDIQGPDYDIIEFVRELLVAVGVDAEVQETGRE